MLRIARHGTLTNKVRTGMTEEHKVTSIVGK